MANAEEWTEWNEERKRFQDLETQGYAQDITTLEAHIKKLQEVAPKDKAGWMNSNCLYVVGTLTNELKRAKTFFGDMPL